MAFKIKKKLSRPDDLAGSPNHSNLQQLWRQVANLAGVVSDAITYDGFGNVVSETMPSFGDRFKWTGREWNSDTGLQYNRARYFLNETGRWLSEDPIRWDGGDANLYRYTWNATQQFTDPSGNAGSSGGDAGGGGGGASSGLNWNWGQMWSGGLWGGTPGSGGGSSGGNGYCYGDEQDYGDGFGNGNGVTIYGFGGGTPGSGGGSNGTGYCYGDEQDYGDGFGSGGAVTIFGFGGGHAGGGSGNGYCYGDGQDYGDGFGGGDGVTIFGFGGGKLGGSSGHGGDGTYGGGDGWGDQGPIIGIRPTNPVTSCRGLASSDGGTVGVALQE